MSTLTNTATRYGMIARVLHWLTALLILTAIPLGLVANGMAYDTGEALALKAQVFSIHKTLGVAAFAVGLLRILWAVVQVRPAPVHPDRKAETLLAEIVHWTLYLSLVLVPLSGWVHHAATTGFAPILWPLGQDLPGVPKSESVAQAAAALHWLFTKLLAASVLLHVAGALKHAIVDRDGVLSRMLRGDEAGTGRAHGGFAAPVIAAALYAVAGFAVLQATAPAPAETSMGASAPVAPPAQGQAGSWGVTVGTLSFTVAQMGQPVQGRFADWSADIRYEPTPVEGKHGDVTVQIAVGSLTLGSVTDKAKGTDFLDAGAHPVAVFDADILASPQGPVAQGTLSLRGIEVPVTLRMELTIDGDVARMTGQTVLDRGAFGIGKSYPDGKTVGLEVTVDVALSARRVR